MRRIKPQLQHLFGEVPEENLGAELSDKMKPLVSYSYC
jgi:hypothetical protein